MALPGGGLAASTRRPSARPVCASPPPAGGPWPVCWAIAGAAESRTSSGSRRIIGGRIGCYGNASIRRFRAVTAISLALRPAGASVVAQCVDQLTLGHLGTPFDADFPRALVQILFGPLLVRLRFASLLAGIALLTGLCIGDSSGFLLRCAILAQCLVGAVVLDLGSVVLRHDRVRLRGRARYDETPAGLDSSERAHTRTPPTTSGDRGRASRSEGARG